MKDRTEELKRVLQQKEDELTREIKRRREIEKEYAASRETFKKALKQMPVIIFASDEDGAVVFFNREFERVTGYSAEDITQSPDLLEVLLPKVGDASQSTPESPGTEGEWCFQNKAGEDKIVAWSETSIYFPIQGWKSWKIGMDITELKTTKARLQTLNGLLPICSSCKNIRDDQGYWNQLETYISNHSEADFTHSICPDCVRKLYPNLKVGKRSA